MPLSSELLYILQVVDPGDPLRMGRHGASLEPRVPRRFITVAQSQSCRALYVTFIEHRGTCGRGACSAVLDDARIFFKIK
mmetsp:Transcript_8823/g.21210  ORF Transcript_8823/g.21210 Transcript_8823/m.21210 type:complete len:80 (+) Transcript_8823:591-830(+)|eukprot:4008786-Prymnesium_polylepis.1